MKTRLATGTTIFTEMTQLANRHRAVNLAQGFPDFPGPEFVREAAIAALAAKDARHDQYAPMTGLPALRQAVVAHQRRWRGLDYDVEHEVLIGCGAVELLTSSLLAFAGPDAEVLLLEPFYDSYLAAAKLADAPIRTMALSPPDFRLDPARLAAAITPRTRVLVINQPHNPTGRVFDATELAAIAAVAIAHDLLVICDEVYEHLVYGGSFVSLRSLPGMRERTLAVSSMSKTFSLTGWRIGWLVGPAALVASVRAVHQFVTFAAPTPLQHAAAVALAAPDAYFEELLQQLAARRRKLGDALDAIGFDVWWPDGAYFLCVGTARLFGDTATDRDVCTHLTTEIGVAAIPPSAFYLDGAPQPYIRFTFAKTDATLDAAIERLRRISPSSSLSPSAKAPTE